MDNRKKQALETAFQKFLEQQNAEGFNIENDNDFSALLNTEKKDEEPEVATSEEEELPELDELEARAAAQALARYIAEQRAKEKTLAEAKVETKAEMAKEAASEAKPTEGLKTEEPEKKLKSKKKKEKTTKEKKVKPAKEKKEKKKKTAKKDYSDKHILHPYNLAVACVLTVEAIGEVLAWLLDVHDKAQVKVDRVLIEMADSLKKEYFDMLSRYRLSRKRIAKDLFGMTMVVCAMMLVFNHFTVYEYAYNGRVLGYVNDQSEVTEVLDITSAQVSKLNDADIKFELDENISFKRVSYEKKTIDNSDAVVNKLAYMTDIEVTASAVCEDGKVLAIVENDSVAESILDTVKSEQSRPDQGMKILKSDFQGKITVKPVTIMLTSVQSRRAAYTTLLKGGSYDVNHIVSSGETVNSIASEFTVATDKILDAESGKAVREVKSGDKVIIRKEVEAVKVEILEEGTMSEVIPFKEIRTNTSDLYKGDTSMKQKGVDGKQVITGKVTKVNGEITKRDLKKKEIVSEAVDQIILVGTAERPKTAPTGVFGMPIRNYTITSTFGGRWGRMHEGIDFGAGTGTAIYASDGGTVTTSGYAGAYGLCIDINHGSGKMTRYGHCSRLLVGSGEKVYKGQLIALVGNTGRSTGSHLHFEIRYGGSVVDPGPILGLY